MDEMIKISVLYEDRDLLVIDKPAGILSAPAPEGGTDVPTLLAAEGKKAESLVPVTRLDRNVSGVALYTKNSRAAAFYSPLVGDHTLFKKEYLAVVQGVPAEEEGSMKDLLFKDAARNKTYVVSRMRRGVREASLSYRVLQTVEGKDGPLTLVRVLLHTGRTHQIRVQFASRRMPLWGDGKYGGKSESRIALHAYALSFPRRENGTFSFVSPMPEGEVWGLFTPADIERRKPE